MRCRECPVSCLTPNQALRRHHSRVEEQDDLAPWIGSMNVPRCQATFKTDSENGTAGGSLIA